jgi:hypothetical protein
MTDSKTSGSAWVNNKSIKDWKNPRSLSSN